MTLDDVVALVTSPACVAGMLGTVLVGSILGARRAARDRVAVHDLEAQAARRVAAARPGECVALPRGVRPELLPSPRYGFDRAGSCVYCLGTRAPAAGDVTCPGCGAAWGTGRRSDVSDAISEATLAEYAAPPPPRMPPPPPTVRIYR